MVWRIYESTGPHMDTVAKCLNVEIPVSFHPARVVHANKYFETYGGAFDFPVSSTLYTDVVFRLNENNEDYKIYIQKLDLPIYTDQEVTVICSGKLVLGYIDMQTNYYYYTINNFSRSLGLGLSPIWLWTITILGGIALYFIRKEEILLSLFLLCFSMYFVYLIQRWYINRSIKKAINAALS